MASKKIHLLRKTPYSVTNYQLQRTKNPENCFTLALNWTWACSMTGWWANQWATGDLQFHSKRDLHFRHTLIASFETAFGSIHSSYKIPTESARLLVNLLKLNLVMCTLWWIVNNSLNQDYEATIYGWYCFRMRWTRPGMVFETVVWLNFLSTQKLINYRPCRDLNPGPPR